MLGLLDSGLLAALFLRLAWAGPNMGPPYAPGDLHYPVQLQSMVVSDGALRPPFRGDRADYELRLLNRNPSGLVITLGLDLKMYNLLHTPKIRLDGKEVAYSPLNLISVPVPLNWTIGPLEKTVHLEVLEPIRGTWLNPAKTMSYKIRVVQPPDYAAVVQASAIVVTDALGRQLVSEPPFRPEMPALHYRLPDDASEVYVQLNCSDFATAALLDERPIGRREKRKVDLRGEVSWKSLAQCQYFDEHWTPSPQSQTYSLSFSRDTRLSQRPPKLTMLSNYGYCESRSDYDRKLGKPPSDSTSPEGFVCVSDKPEPKIFVDLGQEDAEVFLDNPEHKTVVQMKNYLPISLHHGHERLVLALRKHAGGRQQEYPMVLIWPGGCAAMACPERFVTRKVAENARLAERMCLEERCSERDVDVCCEKKATCTAVQCPGKKTLRLSPDSFDCAGTVCGPGDVEHCCEDEPTCRGYECPHQKALRPDAADIHCKLPGCGEKDADRCCVQRASCSTVTCPEGSAPHSLWEDRLCRWSSCDEDDEPHCCRPFATCPSLTCPSGKIPRAGAEGLKCKYANCTADDVDTCCEFSEGVHYVRGVVKAINEDGSCSIRFEDGKLDRHVPEWALHGGQDHSNVYPGETVEVSLSKEGYVHRSFLYGWVQAAHPDGTYKVTYENGEEDDHVPVWALRAVDAEGHLFVHSELFSEGERVMASKSKDGFHHEAYKIASVVRQNEDGTYYVTYDSGTKAKHVPAWDLRAIDDRGHSYVSGTHRPGDTVEVNLGDRDTGVQVQKDQLRTKYLLGRVSRVNPDHTYAIKYDFGGFEDDVPAWAMRYLDGHFKSSSRRKYKEGERVEARISMDIANNLTGWGIEALGIATREKVLLYRDQGCWPAPGRCPPRHAGGAGLPGQKGPPKVPPLLDYDVVGNPKGERLCYFDASCGATEVAGCNYDAHRPQCRFCGFGDLPKCPEPFECSQGFPGSWTTPHRDWCCANYNVGCPFECRWGKWWPDGANGWGPWWTEEKREWCCKNQDIGCARQRSIAKPGQTLQTTVQPASLQHLPSQAGQAQALSYKYRQAKPLASKLPAATYRWACWSAPACGLLLLASLAFRRRPRGLSAGPTARGVSRELTFAEEAEGPSSPLRGLLSL